uniref:Rad21/Rec8-like protein N-terminal domain-containing protein n=1 Tax=Ciona savignyi TaxID=51511 RepID=H2Y8G5_CIOSA
MFYANFVLSKRGPLARIWLAAHWDKKLTKAHVFETNLEDSVETIISPQVKMALRTSGHLLLGVVRIYNRKAKYLLADCNEAFVKIKMAFRPGMVDLPEENREAQHNQIYLVEEFHNFDAPLPDISDIDMDRHLTVTTLNQSRIDEITLPEEVPTTLRLDDGFGGLFGEEQEEAIDGEAAGKQDTVTGHKMSFILEAMDTDGAMDISSPHPQPVVVEGQEETQSESQKQGLLISKLSLSYTQLQVTTTEPSIEEATNVVPEEAKLTINEEEDNKDQTTLVANEEEAFALGPLDVSDVRDMRMRRKRKLVVDHLMELDGQTMREQLKDFNDIVTTLDMAPPTKRLMQWKEMGGVDKLFSIPSKTTDASINK